MSLAAVSFALDQRDEATAWWHQAEMVCQQDDDPGCLAEVELWLGRAALAAQDLASSRAHLREAERHFRRVDQRPGLTAALENLTEIEELEGNAAEAMESRREACTLRQRLGLSALDEDHSLTGEPAPEGAPEPRPQLDQSDPSMARLIFLLRAAPRTAASEERIASLQRGPHS